MTGIHKSVILIAVLDSYRNADGYFPCIGSQGIAVDGPDNYGDYEVVFDGEPGPIPGDAEWTCHKTMLVFIPDSMRVNPVFYTEEKEVPDQFINSFRRDSR